MMRIVNKCGKKMECLFVLKRLSKFLVQIIRNVMIEEMNEFELKV